MRILLGRLKKEEIGRRGCVERGGALKKRAVCLSVRPRH